MEKRIRWSKEKVILELKNLHSNGIKTSAGNLRKNNFISLVQAGLRHFGSWKSVLIAAGLPLNKNKECIWSKEKLRDYLQKRDREGKPTYRHAIRKDSSAVAGAVDRFFNSWDDFYEYSGIERERRYLSWTNDEIIDLVKDLYRQGEDLSDAAIRKSYSKLFSIAKRRFGSWYNVLDCVGINPEPIRIKAQQRKWDKESVIKAIQDRLQQGQKLNTIAVQKNNESLYTAAIRHLGSWDKALELSGYAIDEIKLSRFWSPNVVLKRIKDRVDSGKSIYLTDIYSQDASLYIMSKKYFGSIRKAVTAAGYKYKKKPSSKFGEKILGILLKSFFPAFSFDHNYTNPAWLIKAGNSKKGLLELDYYCENLSLAFEFQGPSHFLPTWGIDKLLKQQENDAIKRELCHNRGITLIEVKYDEFSSKSLAKLLDLHGIKYQYTDSVDYLCKKYAYMYPNKKIPSPV